MKIQLTLLAASVGALAALIAAPNAKADDQSYLAAIDGVYHGVYTPDMMLHWGHGICDDLHGGRSVAQEIAAAPSQFTGYMDVPGVVNAAQRELCPDAGH